MGIALDDPGVVPTIQVHFLSVIYLSINRLKKRGSMNQKDLLDTGATEGSSSALCFHICLYVLASH